ncbi:hypothetical protein [Pseudalkalibacillus caeni]|uniref:hypothetical protein n=1 Tax=Exobacillus caeni TaxID=2574798 RepID=UPI0014856A01|nr:hypothetical protein [Pseudalkalibacillus caeni]
MERFITKSGIYQNLDKRRWEYWLVLSKERKVLVSWLCWNAPKDVYDNWVGSYS